MVALRSSLLSRVAEEIRGSRRCAVMVLGQRARRHEARSLGSPTATESRLKRFAAGNGHNFERITVEHELSEKAKAGWGGQVRSVRVSSDMGVRAHPLHARIGGLFPS